MLKIDWYLEQPIDFEHKNYVLLSYLGELDSSFSKAKLSPYLLHTENLVYDMKNFLYVEKDIRNKFKSEIIGFNFREGPIRNGLELDSSINEVLQIVDYSLPILEVKIKFGYFLLKKYPQILF